MDVVRNTLSFLGFILIQMGDVLIRIVLMVHKIAQLLFQLLILQTKRIEKWMQRKKTQVRLTVVSWTKSVKYSILLKTLLVSRKVKRFKKFFKRRKEYTIIKKGKKVYPVSFFYKLRFFLFGVVFSFVSLFLPLLILVVVADLPNPYALSAIPIEKTTKIYDRNGNLLYEVYANQNRTVVKLQEIPEYLQHATIAVEDREFYQHPGFNIKGIVRAAIANIKNKELQGGSTITQQLIKSAFLTPSPTLVRKIKEVILAFWAERIYSKDKILELYFNYVPYGGTAWGVQAASEVYFGKPVSTINLAESAFLAGMPKAPSLYSPHTGHPNFGRARQREVLNAMVSAGFISQSEAEQAYNEQLVLKDPLVPIKAPHFVMYVKDILTQKYGLREVEKGGLRVITTLDLSLQQKAEQIVLEEIQKNASLSIKNGAALITDPKNGDMVAMVGNHNYFDKDNGGNVNIVTSSRQPGSAIKIVTYSLALSSGFTEVTLLEDSPLTIQLENGQTYSPVNYSGRFHGKLPLRFAFANSLNIPAVRLAQRLGVDRIVQFGKSMGIYSWKDASRYGLSITLGGGEVTMLDLARAYGTIANEGRKVEPDPLLEVRDFEGNIIYRKSSEEQQIVDPGIAFIISDILSDNQARSLEFGLQSPLVIPGHNVSVKTGTSDNKRDNWTVGYTREYVVVTWVGNHDNTPMSPLLTSGITGAAPIWNKIMGELLKGKIDIPWPIPSNVIKKTCMGREAYFIRGTESTVFCGIFPSLAPHVSR